MIPFRRGLLPIVAGGGLILAACACNLMQMIEPPVTATESFVVPATMELTVAGSTAIPDGDQTSPPTDVLPPTSASMIATPQAETTTFRRDEDFGSYLLTTYTTTTRYPITGSTAEELDAAIRRNGPRDEASGTGWFALTVPLFDWDWGCVCDNGGCRSDAPAISLSISYSLPAWHHDDPPLDLLAQWTAFEQALTAHERGHGDLAHACAMSLGERVAAVSGVESCEAVDQRALAEINDGLALCRADQRAYEDRTNHGTNDGVVWPP